MGHRERLLDAARRLVQEHGYADVTTRDLVAASGTNLASIGYHFGSKDALLQEAIGQIFDEWNAKLGRAALAGEDVAPLDRVTTSWRTMLADFTRHRSLFVAELEAATRAQRSEPLRRLIANHYEHARDAIAEMVLAGLPGAREEGVDARAVASFLMAVGDGLMLQHLVDPDRAPSVDELEAALGAALALALAGAGSAPS